MSKLIFDYNDGDFIVNHSDDMAFDSDGDMMLKLSDNMAMDMDSGEIHITSSWSDEEE